MNRKQKARIKALNAEIKTLTAKRRSWRESNLHWGTPVCTGGDYCEGPTCIGCAIAAWATEEVASYTAQIKAMHDEITQIKAPVISGELFTMAGDRWVLA